MKKITFTLVFILFAGFCQAQFVNIPDPAFKAALINMGLDADFDGEISEAEAAYIYDLSLPNLGIYNLSGLEMMPNVMSLDVSNNPISGAFFGANTQLTFLNVSNTSISVLDLSGLGLLDFLICSNTPVFAIGLTGCSALSNVQITGTQLTAIDFSDCPALTNVFVSGNFLNSMDFGPVTAPSLIINADNNQISSLDISSLTNLTNLFVSSNNLAALDLSNNVNLQWLGANGNNLTTLDASNCPLLNNLTLGNNQLETLFIKNGSIENTVGIENNPNLAFICADESQIAAVQSIAGPLVVVNSYCTFLPGGNHNTISGTVLYDANSNGCNASDVPQQFIKMALTSGAQTFYTYTNPLANYTFYTGAGNFSLSPGIENPAFFTVNPTSANVNFATANNLASTQNFCISPYGSNPDLEIVIAPMTAATPGSEAVYKIVFKNKGNQTLSQTYGIVLAYNELLMNFISASLTPATAGSGALSWNYSNLLPFESRSIEVRFQINTPTDAYPVNIDDALSFTTSILPMAGDATTFDNTFELGQTVSGPFDPNDISCLEGDSVSPTQIGEFLHYRVNFENTGNAAANNVVVKIEIDAAKFNIPSLQLLNASHPVRAKLEGSILELIFENIQLDSGGHGNIILKVKSNQNLSSGDFVAKRANIYFDYNFPVATNSAETVFESLGLDEINRPNISISPNPVHDRLNIESQSAIKSLQLFDLHGRLLQSQMGSQNFIDVLNNQPGIYFLKIVTENGSSVQKFIKE